MFKHNDVSDLYNMKLSNRTDYTRSRKHVYSMDGGVANIQPILDVALGYEEFIVVDKTHALGVCGRTSFINLIVPNDESRTPLSLEKCRLNF